MKKGWLCCLIVLGLICFVSVSANAALCTKATEQRAFNHRALQSHLMVAAITCNQHSRYNAFVQKFNTHLMQQNKILKKYFNRAYQRQGKWRFNHFMTSLANSSSKESLSVDYDDFCGKADRLFDDILSQPVRALDKALITQSAVDGLHGMHQCQ